MRKKAWEEEKKSLSLTDIQSQLPAMKKDAATSWLKEVDAKALIFSLRCMKLPIRTFLSIKAVSLDFRQSMTGINLIKLIRTFFLRKKKAKETFDFVVKTAGKHYLLGEQVDNSTLKPNWVIGLGWSHAMFIIVLEKLYKNNLK